MNPREPGPASPPQRGTVNPREPGPASPPAGLEPRGRLSRMVHPSRPLSQPRALAAASRAGNRQTHSRPGVNRADREAAVRRYPGYHAAPIPGTSRRRPARPAAPCRCWGTTRRRSACLLSPAHTAVRPIGRTRDHRRHRRGLSNRELLPSRPGPSPAAPSPDRRSRYWGRDPGPAHTDRSPKGYPRGRAALPRGRSRRAAPPADRPYPRSPCGTRRRPNRAVPWRGRARWPVRTGSGHAVPPSPSDSRRRVAHPSSRPRAVPFHRGAAGGR